MNKQELVELINKGETKLVEFKERFGDDVIESLVAFANSTGGKIVIGVKNNREILGVDISEESLQNWINEIKTKTSPFLTPKAEEIDINGNKLVIFELQEFPIKPVSFKGRYFIRKNNSNHQLSLTEVNDMYLQTRNSSWDFYPDKEATLKDLDEKKIGKIKKMIENNLEINLGTNNNFLKKYSLIVYEGNKEYPSFAAMLLFSKEPLRIADIQIGLFQDMITIKKNKIIREDLFSEVEEVIEFIKSYITKEFIITGSPQREERWQYPLKALREFVINAIVHKDYRDGVHSQFKIFPDKIVLWNIGKLPFNLTIQEIEEGTEKSYPRNKLIAEIFRDAGLIERYGSGAYRAIRDFIGQGLDKPILRETAGGIEVTIFGKKSGGGVNGGVNGGVILLEYIQKNPGKRTSQMESELKIAKRTIERQLKKLKDDGRIEFKGSSKKGGYFLKEMKR